jgi:cytochrome d ubiquinol oxidase subunit I
MDDFLAARLQMALSLGFHIVFASIGIAMPFLMATAHYFYLKKKESDYELLTKAWAKGVAIFFAVGAVSGTALSFELGLLWPGFMKYAGPIIGMPFSWEGTAFFLEAIALGIFLYGWKRVKPWTHWMSGVVVGISGVASAMFVICANAWMNAPAGFDWNNGNPTNINPWAAMFTMTALVQGVHMVIASFQAVGFAVGGLHAILFLRTRLNLHKKALKISFIMGAIASILQPLAGDLLAKNVARTQPVKLAAAEAHFETMRGAPVKMGPIKIPKLLSFLAHGDFNSEVKGLVDFPINDWPSVPIVHFSFDLMISIGILLLLYSLWGLYCHWKKNDVFYSKESLLLFSFLTPLGFLAIEAGWTVTEVGRQPWIIYQIMRTKEALTPRPGVEFTLLLYVLVYTFLSAVVVFLMNRQIKTLHRKLRP